MTLRTAFRALLRSCSNVRRKLNGTDFGSVRSVEKSSQIICYSSWSSKSNSSQSFNCGFISISVIGLSSVFYYKFITGFDLLAEERGQVEVKAGEFIDGLPVYKLADVENHKTKEERIWVVYKSGVYDVTDFVDEHPGGTKILLAAGSSIEPFWLLYGVHNNPEVYELLEQYRIGNFDREELELYNPVNDSDPYSGDPKRHPALLPASRKPFNGEPPLSILVDEFYTPNEIFYVRNHLPVPKVDPAEYRLKIEGLGVKSKSFTLSEIKKFPKHSVTATVQCAGNRRSEMTSLKPVKGLNWNQAAIGNAKWSGARLRDVLDSCGFSFHPNLQHVQFEGLDRGPDDLPYGASVPAHKVFDPFREVLLVYEMNGKELPRDHGYPLRVIVPGIVGARNVKWVTKIVLSESESDSFWQQYDYKGFSPSTGYDTADFSKAVAIQELPINSAICVPENGSKVDVFEGCILVKGYAWSGGGNEIIRVDVTADKGKTWHVADLKKVEEKESSRWAWTLWSILVPVEPGNEEAEIWVKAVDESYNSQPETFEHIWNLRGLLANAYHRIKVKLVN